MGELKDEIRQTKPFASLEEEVYLNIQRTAEALSWAVAEVLKNSDLTPVQYNVLRILRGAGTKGLMCNEIGERLVTKDSDVTRLVVRLEGLGLIERERCSNDRRIIYSRITDKGLALLAELDEPIVACANKQLGHFGSDELELFKKMLVTARKKVKKIQTGKN